jgi:lipopolysaccharide biosynthesis regulator YciM
MPGDWSALLPWFLLPAAAGAGWWAARRARAHDGSGQLSADYFKGLNYLLNEQPDKAIEVFMRMVEVDHDTLETHFALGNLFRRRGEVDRAIRIHQNLIARPALLPEQRQQALLALGEDYMRAGLFDRAENLYKELLELQPRHVGALNCLIDIYQQEKDWLSAVEALRERAAATGEMQGDVMAQYYCELATQASARGDAGAAHRNLDRALASDPRCARASLLRGELHMQGGAWEEAIGAYKQVEGQDAEYLPEVIEPLRQCYLRLGRPYDILPWLQGLVERGAGLSLMLAQAALLRERDGDRAAAAFITSELMRRPSVRGLSRLIELHLAYSEGGARRNLLILRDLTQKLLEERPVYRCAHCGFRGKSLHWQCPGCKRWNTVKPVHGVEGE